MDLQRATINRLAQLLRTSQGTVVPFVGAGCSIPFGCPSWMSMIEQLLHAGVSGGQVSGQTEELVRKHLASGALYEAGQVIEDAFGVPPSASLALALETICRMREMPEDSIVHRLHMLPCSLVLTTNYDSVLESFWWHGRRVRVTTEFEPRFIGAAPPRPTLLKLHGDIERPETVILSHRAATTTLRSNLSKMEVMAASRSFFFIGFGLADRDLLLPLEVASVRLPSAGEHFALLPSTRRHELQAFERLGIRPIWYDVGLDGSHAGALEVFKQIAETFHPGLASVRFRRHVPAGVIAWVADDQRTAIMVDSFGNVVAEDLEGHAPDFESDDTAKYLRLFLLENTGADDVWLHRASGRWQVWALFGNREVQLGDGEKKSHAALCALCLIPDHWKPERPLRPELGRPERPTREAVGVRPSFRHVVVSDGTLIGSTDSPMSPHTYWYFQRATDGKFFALGPGPRPSKQAIARVAG